MSRYLRPVAPLALALLLALLLGSCTVSGYYRREARYIANMQEADFRNGILRADPTYYLSRWLGLPTRRAAWPPPHLAGKRRATKFNLLP